MREFGLEEKGAVYVVTWLDDATPEEVARFFALMDKYLLLRRPMALVLNALHVKKAPSEGREVASRWLKDHRAELRLFVKGEATVISSPLVRGMLAAVHLFAPPGYPTKTFATLAPAVEWAQQKVAGK